jgi:hypothetical protein
MNRARAFQLTRANAQAKSGIRSWSSFPGWSPIDTGQTEHPAIAGQSRQRP